ncbi:hypothetical protein G6F70_000992 [Rhizopus microsporus]|nr:hypothetical protein G6F71_007513 [Rhizopus microsporus]KAG1203907.1 hypothetical protein G6F70_000992 [Rhizopus microsporus]KAG1229267.1 hypothetical protein G6F67_007265 [Rhizopus microsporus]
MHANWSLNSDTLEKYYYKPRDQHQRGRILTTKIFENATENRTTSEVGVKPTAIVLGTTHNGNVGETKTENVVATRPWYRRWFAISSHPGHQGFQKYNSNFERYKEQ